MERLSGLVLKKLHHNCEFPYLGNPQSINSIGFICILRELMFFYTCNALYDTQLNPIDFHKDLQILLLFRSQLL